MLITVEETTPIRQGDIFINSKNANDIKLVITADCDLANSKHSGFVNTLDILENDFYINNYCWPNYKDETIKKNLETIIEVLSKKEIKNLSIKSLDTWIDDESFPSQIAEKINFKSIEHQFNIIKKLKTTTNPLKTIKEINTEPNFQKQIGKFLDTSKTYSDILIIPNEIESKHRLIYLRQIKLIDISFLKFTQYQARADENFYFRYKRMEDRYKYLAVQKMCNLFMRIGIKKDTEDLIEISTEIYKEKLKETI